MTYELRSTYIIIGALLMLLLKFTCSGSSSSSSATPQPQPKEEVIRREVVYLHDTVYITAKRERVAEQRQTVVHLRDTVYITLPAASPAPLSTVAEAATPPAEVVEEVEVVEALPAADTSSQPLPDPRPLSRYQFGVYGGGGVQQLLAGVTGGSMEELGLAPTFGAEFAYYFASHWGVSLGADVSFYGVRLIASGVTSGDDARIVNRHDEALRATYIGVPLLLQFRAPVWRRHTVQAAAGGRFDFAVAGSYRVTGSRQAIVAGSTAEIFTYSGTASFRPGVTLFAEAGVRWSLGKQWGLYTGAYAGYGLSDVLRDGAATQEPGTGSLLNLRNTNGTPYINNIRLLPAGVKLKISYEL
jgi:hypothetical protein